MESDDMYVWIVYLTDHNDNSNTVEGVFLSRESAHNWVILNGSFAADVYGTSELLSTNYDWWDVIKRGGGVYVKTGKVVSIYRRSVTK